MSIYFTSKVVEFSRYEGSVRVSEEEHASFNLGNSRSLRCLLPANADSCGQLTISAAKCSQWIARSYEDLSQRVNSDIPFLWKTLSTVALELSKGDSIGNEEDYSRIGVVVTWS